MDSASDCNVTEPISLRCNATIGGYWEANAPSSVDGCVLTVHLGSPVEVELKSTLTGGERLTFYAGWNTSSPVLRVVLTNAYIKTAATMYLILSKLELAVSNRVFNNQNYSVF